MTEWIKCSKRLSPAYDYVLVFCNSPGTGEPKPIGIARQINGTWDLSSNDYTGYCQDLEWNINPEYITHWAELPEAPHDSN